MKLRLLGFSVTTLAALAVPAVLAGCDQPAITCSIGHAGAQLGYATIFTKVSGGDCTPAPGIVDVMGAENFHGADKATNTRDLDVDNVALSIGDNLISQQRFAACWSTEDPVSGYKPAHDYTDPGHTLFSLGKFKDLNPDANDMCFAENLTTAEQNMPAIPATTADVNPAPTGCPNSPSALCDNGDGFSQNPGCVCPTMGDDDCCDRFQTYCDPASSPKSTALTACSVDKDCCAAGDNKCMMKPVKGACSQTPLSICPGGDPETGLPVPCTKDDDCADLGVMCTPVSIPFCSNKPSIIGCASDADCCDPTDTACLGAKHTCNPAGVDFASCHTAPQAALDLKYQWDSVQFYETAASPGTQIKGELTYSTGTCTEKFEAFAIWPAIDCTKTDPSTGATVTDDMGNPLPDPLSCCPGADPAKGHAVGSSISPEFDVECVPTNSFTGGAPTAFNWVFFADIPASFVCAAKHTDKFPAVTSSGVPDGCPKPAPIE